MEGRKRMASNPVVDTAGIFLGNRTATSSWEKLKS